MGDARRRCQWWRGDTERRRFRLSSGDGTGAPPHLPSPAAAVRPRRLVAREDRLRDLRRRDPHAEYVVGECREGASRLAFPWASVVSSPSRPRGRRAGSPCPLGRMLQRQGAAPRRVRALPGAGVCGSRVGDAQGGSVAAAPEAARGERRRSGDGGFDRSLCGGRPALRGRRVHAPRLFAPRAARRDRAVRRSTAFLHGPPSAQSSPVQRLPRADRHACQGCLPAASALRSMPSGPGVRPGSSEDGR